MKLGTNSSTVNSTFQEDNTHILKVHFFKYVLPRTNTKWYGNVGLASEDVTACASFVKEGDKLPTRRLVLVRILAILRFTHHSSPPQVRNNTR